MSEVQKPKEVEAPAPKEKNDAIKAWEATNIYKAAQQARETEGTKSAQALETPEGKAGALHGSYDKKIKALSAAAETQDPESDRNTLRKSEITDIRTNSRLLKTKKSEEKPEEQVVNLKEETARRMRAYTQESANDWHALNYQKMGSDSKGRSHEMHIGLGDILLDPDITQILVSKDGITKKATRGTLGTGRAAFLYEDGTYAATYTGDKFRILDGTETKPEDKTPEGKKAVDRYIEKLGTEETTRGTQKEYFQKNPDFGTYTPSNDEIGRYDGTIELGNVVDQIKGLSGGQIAAARVIEEEFRKALTGKLEPLPLNNAIAAAIINAKRESGLNPRNDRGDSGTSVGLFQLHAGGGASRLQKKYGNEWKKYAQDPRINTIEMIETEVLGNFGKKRFMPRAAAGASAAELAGIFAYDLERPTDQAGAARRSENLILAHFGKEKPADTIENGTMIAKGKETIFKSGEHQRPGISTLADNQDFWIWGSSIAHMMTGNEIDENGKSTNKIGVLGIGASNAVSFLTDIKSRWSALGLDKMTKPKEGVVLLGWQVNGLDENADPEKTARKNIADYMKVVAFLESKGIKARIATTHEVAKKINSVKKFNEILLKEYPSYAINIAPAVSSGNVHLSNSQSRNMSKLLATEMKRSFNA